ncbi:MAG: hypothetical protein JO081_11440 [Alphaproteobacteria bacterium]|nr:hypothetical protein [Alphaproteobacteria bacterium]
MMRILTKAMVIGLGLCAGAVTTAHAQYYNYYPAPNSYYWGNAPYAYYWGNAPYPYYWANAPYPYYWTNTPYWAAPWSPYDYNPYTLNGTRSSRGG